MTRWLVFNVMLNEAAGYMSFLLYEAGRGVLTVRWRAIGLRVGIIVDVVELGARLTEENLSIRREAISVQ